MAINYKYKILDQSHLKYNTITIEGNIGVGKTTLTKYLQQIYGGKLVLEAFADNPFLPKFYENPKQYAFPVELFFMAERFKQMSAEENQPDIFQPLIFSDYIFSKSILFAQQNLNGDELILYKKLFDIIYKQIAKPDILIFLYADTTQLLSNIHSRGRDYEKHITAEYLNKITEAYMQFIKMQHDWKIVIVNANKINNYNTFYNEKILPILCTEFSVGIHYR